MIKLKFVEKNMNGHYVYEVTNLKSFKEIEMYNLFKSKGTTRWNGSLLVTTDTSSFSFEEMSSGPFANCTWAWKYVVSDVKLSESRKHVRPFESLTKRGKAVRIAKDVLAQIAAKKFKTIVGQYFGPYTVDADKIDGLLEGCHVCVLGASVLSACKLSGRRQSFANGWAGRSGITEFLKDYFDNPQEIEAAFEVGSGRPEGYVSSPVANEWDKAYPNSTDRLTAIMNNIIKNRGVFKFKEVV